MLAPWFLFACSRKNYVEGHCARRAHYFPLYDSEVNLANASDSTLIAQTSTNEKGEFTLEIEPQNKAVYLLVQDALEGDYIQSFERLDESIDFGKITINPMVYDLQEVVITADASAIVVKQDTLEFNAEAYKVKPNANLENLLRELPGFELDDDGTITVNGKEVNEVLIDGEPFFGRDGKVALENLPADIIKKVQVSDYKTQQERFAGQRSRSDNSTLNITLKEDKKQGYMAKITAGYGTEDHHELNALLNYFKANRKINLIASSTDIASTGLPSGTGSRGRGGMGRRGSSGVTTNTLVGLNYNDKLNDQTKIGVDYRFDQSKTDNDQYQRVENLLPDRPFISESNTQSANKSDSHTASASLEWEKNNTKIFFNPNFSQTKSTAHRSYEDITTTNSGEFRNERVGETSNESLNNSFRNQLTLYQKFKNNTYLNFNFDFSYNDADADLFTNETTNYLDSIDIRNNYQRNFSKTSSYTMDLNYNFALSDSIQLALGTIWNRNIDSNQNKTWDFDAINNSYDDYNDELSRLYETTFSRWNPYTQFTLNKTAWMVNIRLGTNIYHQNSFGSYRSRDYEVNKEKISPAIESNFRYKNGNNTYSLSYRYNTGLASTTQLLAFEDLSSTLNIVRGNLNLDATRSHNVNFFYSNFDRKTRQGFNASLGYNYEESGIINMTTYDENFVRYTTYENSSGNYRLNGFLNWNKQLTKGIHKFRANIGLNASYARQQRYVSNGVGTGIHQQHWAKHKTQLGLW
ncbi:outer membrane beta-barrel protein [Vaginella massiliensis]|uniref:outer membrane beta-barrel protein n=1 Tax=Vaginella massiliensis TaxID=1816680 RepID=UPI00375285E3